MKILWLSGTVTGTYPDLLPGSVNNQALVDYLRNTRGHTVDVRDDNTSPKTTLMNDDTQADVLIYDGSASSTQVVADWINSPIGVVVQGHTPWYHFGLNSQAQGLSYSDAEGDDTFWVTENPIQELEALSTVPDYPLWTAPMTSNRLVRDNGGNWVLPDPGNSIDGSQIFPVAKKGTRSAIDTMIWALEAGGRAADGITISAGRRVGVSLTDNGSIMSTQYRSLWATSVEWAGGANPTSDTEAPTTVTDLTATVVGDDIHLDATPATDNVAVVGYKVYSSQTQGFTPGGSNLINPLASLPYVVTAPAVGVHYFRVVAVDAANNESAPSNEASATIEAPYVPYESDRYYWDEVQQDFFSSERVVWNEDLQVFL